MTTHIKISGSWQEIAGLWVKSSGSWAAASNLYLKDGGTWKEVWSAAVPSVNLLDYDDGTLDAGIGGWQNNQQTVLSHDTSTYYQGTGSLKIVLASPYNNAYCNSAKGLSGVPVSPSTQYSGHARIYGAGTARTWNVNLAWYNSSGTYISRSSGATTSTSTGWGRRTVTATSPSNAAYAALEVRIQNGTGAETFYIDVPQLQLGAVSAWEAPDA